MSNWLNCPNCGGPLTVVDPAPVDYMVAAHRDVITTMQQAEAATYLVCGNDLYGTWEEIQTQYGALAQRLEIEMTGRQIEVPSAAWPYHPVKEDLLKVKCTWSGRLLKLVCGPAVCEVHVSIHGFTEILRSDTIHSYPGFAA
jgi:hypothetical protein